MKLSEAIREGAKLHPQAFGEFFTTIFNPKTQMRRIERSCALGALIEGLKLPIANPQSIQFNRPGKVLEEVPSLQIPSYCPVVACERGQTHGETLYDIIIHLNDTHHWSREQIADWLERLDS